MTRQIKINISEITETFDVYSLAASEKAKIIKAQADELEKADAKITRLRAENEKLREETRSKGERIGGYVNMLVKREAEIEKLRAALKPFADVAENDIGDDETDADIFRPITGRYNHAPLLTVGDLRTAAAALKETGK